MFSKTLKILYRGIFKKLLIHVGSFNFQSSKYHFAILNKFIKNIKTIEKCFRKKESLKSNSKSNDRN